MRAYLTGTSCSGNAALPFVAGIACSVAILCGGFWVFKYRTSSSPVKHGSDIDTEAEEREDKISQLPDGVISSVISRLGTKEAVRTSILSRRWRRVYTFITKVRFSCCEIANYSPCYRYYKEEKLSLLQRELVQRVDTFLQLHAGYKIVSFELACCFGGCFLENSRKWMNSFGRLGVEQLTLLYCRPYYMHGSDPPIFSSDFLDEALSVKHLILRGCSFQAPNQNTLTVLELRSAVFTSEQVASILSNCLSLQSLKFKDCQLPSKLLIQGPDLQLKSLTLYHCSNVAEVDLSAMNLIDLQLCNLSMLKLSFSYLPSLQNLFIGSYFGVVPPCVFGKVAKDLPHLKCMFFRTNARFFEGYKIAGVINNLSNLRQLVLLLAYSNKLDLLAVAAILDACPLLHKFHLSMMKPSRFNGKQAEEREVSCHTQLKEVEYCGFSGTKNEYNFILYILENVVSLERLTIFLRPRDYEVDEDRWVMTESNTKDDEMKHTTAESNTKDDEKKHRNIGEWLKGHTISKNVDITIV